MLSDAASDDRVTMDAWEPERPSAPQWAFARGFACRHVQDSANSRASPSGHLEEDENILEAGIRETKEETGIALDPATLRLALSIHQRNPGSTHTRIGFAFEPGHWDGEPLIGEPAKCSQLVWADPGNLPSDTVEYTAAIIRAVQRGVTFALNGW